MKVYQDKVIVAVDTGYGNIKTANHCFRTGITAYDSEPLFTKDMLIYGGKYYLRQACGRHACCRSARCRQRENQPKLTSC